MVLSFTYEGFLVNTSRAAKHRIEGGMAGHFPE